MKFIKQILIAGLLAFASFAAQAQYDYFAQPRFLMFPQATTQNAGATSNNVIDLSGYDGPSALLLTTITNGACSAAIVTLQGSSDRTNWSNLSYGLMSSNSVVRTNNNVLYQGVYYFTPQLATNVLLYAGVKTTPNAAYAGFTTPYLNNSTALFTNTGAITLSNAVIGIGFNASDVPRYLNLVYSFTGASTNTTSGVLVTHKQSE